MPEIAERQLNGSSVGAASYFVKPSGFAPCDVVQVRIGWFPRDSVPGEVGPFGSVIPPVVRRGRDRGVFWHDSSRFCCPRACEFVVLTKCSYSPRLETRTKESNVRASTGAATPGAQ